MAIAEYILLDPAILETGHVFRVTGNGLKAALTANEDPNVVFPRGRFLAVQASALKEVILVDEGDVRPAPEVIAIPVPEPPPTQAAPSDVPTPVDEVAVAPADVESPAP